MLPEYFIYIGTLISFIGGLSYVRLTLQGKVQPNKLSWLLIGIATMIAFFAAISEVAGKQALLSFIVGFNPLMVFAASFVNKKAYWKLTKFDYLCGIFSIFAIVAWLLSGNGNQAIALSILADISAALPIFKKSNTHPLSESYVVFLFGIVNAVFVLLTITNWAFATYAFPLYILIFNVLLVATIVGRRKVLNLSRKTA